MARGMPHGRVLIGDGAVDKACVLVHAKSASVMPPNHDKYRSVIAENERLKETNGLLIEENGVHRDLVMVKIVYYLHRLTCPIHAFLCGCFLTVENLCGFQKRTTC